MAAVPTTTDPTTSPGGAGGFIAQIIDLIKGFKGGDKDNASQIADVADPFRQRRNQSQEMLFKLLGDPGSFSLDPGQQFALDTGLGGVARHGNAMFGTTRVGNTAVELNKFGTGFANQAYNDRIKQLMEMSGVSIGNPGAAAQAISDGFKNQDLSKASGFKGLDALFAGLAPGIANLFKSIFGGDGGGVTDEELDQLIRELGGGDGDGGATGDPFNPDPGFTDPDPPDFTMPDPFTPEDPFDIPFEM
jgi:hypothetical protein